MKNLSGIYIHWPFCKSKCPYCDFNSHVGNYNYDDWTSAYLKELDYYIDQNNIIPASRLNQTNDFEGEDAQHTNMYVSTAESRENRLDHLKMGAGIKSIFFGGGTPSLMHPKIVESIISKIGVDNIEITLEANPTSYERQKFIDFKNAGVNRISIGVQSFDDKYLKFLGREHSGKQAIEAIESAMEIFDRYSFDLIYARPEQTMKEWESELEIAKPFINSHVSLYQLTIEKGTKFYAMHKNKEFIMPDDELSEEMYEYTEDFLEELGVYKYEVSNYAKPGHESIHNLGYWRYNQYLGIGPGAHSRININGKLHAVMDIHSPSAWMNKVNEQGHGIQSSAELNLEDIAKEYLMMRLRIFEPILWDDIKQFNEYINYNNINILKQNGFINTNKDGFSITKKGMKLHNSLVQKLFINK